MQPERLSDEIVMDWGSIFDFSGPAAHFQGLIESVSVTTDDIYTGRLSHTRGFFNRIEDGRLSLLHVDLKTIGFAGAIHVLQTIGTHSRLSRLPGIRPVRRLGRVMVRDADDVARPAAVIYLPDLEKLTGFPRAALREILIRLAQDGLVRIIAGVLEDVGIALEHGAINNAAVSRNFTW